MSEPWIAQMRKGLVELCVLAVLREGEDYGYGIVQGLEGVEGLALTEGTIYPVLGRLAREGLVHVRVAASRAGPRRRYYALTRGRDRLREMEIYWHALSQGVERILRAEEATRHLVTGDNVCGESGAGTDSEGTPRTVSSGP